MQHFIFFEDRLLLKKDGNGKCHVPDAEEVPTGLADGCRTLDVWLPGETKALASALEHPVDEDETWILCGLRASFAFIMPQEYKAAGKAFQILYWDKHSHYCPACGTLMRQHTPIMKKCPQCGYESYPPRSVHPDDFWFNPEKGRILNSYQLLYITEGSGLFYTSHEKSLRLQSGDMFMLRPYMWHSYFPDKRTGWMQYWIGFKGVDIDNRIRNDFFNLDQIIYKVGLRDDVVNLYEKALDVAKKEKASYQQYLAGIANLLLGIMMYSDKNTIFQEKEAYARINRAKLIIANSKIFFIRYSNYPFKTVCRKRFPDKFQFLETCFLYKYNKELLKTALISDNLIFLMNAAFCADKVMRPRAGTTRRLLWLLHIGSGDLGRFVIKCLCPCYGS